MDSLVHCWNVRDGAQWFELSPKLAKFLILNDSVFFQVMSADENAFASWLSSLQEGTFNVYSFGDAVDSVLEEAKLLKLRELMLSKVSRKSQDMKYGALARRLRVKLKQIQIEFAD
jgi:hypothetical protein